MEDTDEVQRDDESDVGLLFGILGSIQADRLGLGPLLRLLVSPLLDEVKSWNVTNLQTLMYPHAGFERVCEVERTVVFMEGLISHAVVHCRQSPSPAVDQTTGTHHDLVGS